MATKISFLNIKGGVGKTSLIVNVGACLAYMGKRVLIVDFDAQSNASIWLMRLDRWNGLNHHPEKFILSVFQQNEHSIADCIQKDVIKDSDDEAALPGLDLIPASFNLMDLEHEVANEMGIPFYAHFFEQLQSIEDGYDFILFDCPPNFFYSPQCAIFSSNWILVPANPDALSIIGFHLLVEKLHKFKAESSTYAESLSSPNPDILGISLNSVKPGTRIDVPVERLQAQLERFIEQGRISAKASIFPEQIRHSVAVGRAVMQGMPMVLLGKSQGSMNVAEDFIKTAQRILSLTTQANEPQLSPDTPVNETH